MWFIILCLIFFTLLIVHPLKTLKYTLAFCLASVGFFSFFFYLALTY